MTEEKWAELEANVKSVTDRMTIVDEIFKANKMGRTMVMAFQCGESRLYYPANYVKDWGKEYGIGLGPHPVSESLQSEYDVAPPAITPETQSILQIMHPLRSSGAQMDLCTVDELSYKSGLAVLAKGDEKLGKRSPILYARQCVNTRGRLGLIRASWAQLGKELA